MLSFKELVRYILVTVIKNHVSWQWLPQCTKNSKFVDRWHVLLFHWAPHFQGQK